MLYSGLKYIIACFFLVYFIVCYISKSHVTVDLGYSLDSVNIRRCYYILTTN